MGSTAHWFFIERFVKISIESENKPGDVQECIYSTQIRLNIKSGGRHSWIILKYNFANSHKRGFVVYVADSEADDSSNRHMMWNI